MKILLTGTTGYIGKRLLPVLLNAGHEVYCCVRDKRRFDSTVYASKLLKVVEVNFLDEQSLSAIPTQIDAAYYLIHSMSASKGDFEKLEQEAALNFRNRMQQTQVKQVIYLSGIVNANQLSKHLDSRKQVEETLSQGSYNFTVLRAGIIIGSGSASFEIMRDLVEKLPVMVTPKWLNTRSQPIAIRNVIAFLSGVLNYPAAFNRAFDIGGPEVLTYKQMLLQLAKIRGLRRKIFIVPVMTPRLSSYWLYFVTSTSYPLAIQLVNSMKVEVIGKPNDLHKQLNINILNYEEAIKLAFDKIEQRNVLSSWTDAQSRPVLEKGISQLIQLPEFGCYHDKKQAQVFNEEQTLENFWTIGGQKGWYYANWLWSMRGFIDKLFGGVGLRRGRRSVSDIRAGDALDFWRVIYANKAEKRLMLYAEMKLPGEAWLEFKIENGLLYQTATFRPLGLLGRLYWFSLLPFHAFIFRGMLKRIAS